jgi:hypothetical protein
MRRDWEPSILLLRSGGKQMSFFLSVTEVYPFFSSFSRQNSVSVINHGNALFLKGIFNLHKELCILAVDSKDFTKAVKHHASKSKVKGSSSSPS